MSNKYIYIYDPTVEWYTIDQYLKPRFDLGCREKSSVNNIVSSNLKYHLSFKTYGWHLTSIS